VLQLEDAITHKMELRNAEDLKLSSPYEPWFVVVVTYKADKTPQSTETDRFAG
jgi:hypothetical protein